MARVPQLVAPRSELAGLPYRPTSAGELGGVDEGLTAGLFIAARTVGHVAQQEQARAERIAYTEADNALLGQYLDLEAEVAKRRGHDAIAAPSKLGEEWTKRTAKVGEKLPDRVKRLVSARAQEYGLRLRNTAVRHAANETENLEQAAYTERIDLTLRAAQQAEGDAGRLGEVATAIEQTVRAEFGRRGASDLADAQVAKSVEAVYVLGVDALFAQGRNADAAALYQAHRDKITDQRPRLDEQVRQQTDLSTLIEHEDRIYGKFGGRVDLKDRGNEQAALEAARAVPDQYRDEVVRRVQARFRELNAAIGDVERNAADLAYEHFERAGGTNEKRIPAGLWQQMSPESRVWYKEQALRQRQRLVNPEVDDLKRFAEFLDRKPESLAQLTNQQVREHLQGHVSQQLVLRAMAIVEDSKVAFLKSAGDGYSRAQINQAVNNAARAAKITSKESVAELHRFVFDRLDPEMQAGQGIKFDRLQQVLDEGLTYGEMAAPWYRNSENVFRFEADPSRIFESFGPEHQAYLGNRAPLSPSDFAFDFALDLVPEQARQAILAQFPDADDELIVRVYLESLGPREDVVVVPQTPTVQGAP